MGYHVCQHVGLQHIPVLHIDRRSGIWLCLGLEVELPWVIWDGLNDTSTCTLGLMLSVFERRSVSFLRTSCHGLIAKEGRSCLSGNALMDWVRTLGRCSCSCIFHVLGTGRGLNGFAPQLDLNGAYRAGNRSRGQACTVLRFRVLFLRFHFLGQVDQYHFVLGCI